MKLGFGELLVIFIVALLVIGPDKLPEYARKLGAGLREFRNATSDVTQEIRESVIEPLNEAQQPLREAMEPLEEMQTDIEREVKGVEKSLNDVASGRPAKKTVKKTSESAAAEPEEGAETTQPESQKETTEGEAAMKSETQIEPEEAAEAEQQSEPEAESAEPERPADGETQEMRQETV